MTAERAAANQWAPRKSVNQSVKVAPPSLQRLPDFSSWLLPGQYACPRFWIICFIGSVCFSQCVRLAGTAYAVARELIQSEQSGSFPLVSRQVSRAVHVLAGERESMSGRGGCRVKWSMWSWVHAQVCMCFYSESEWVCVQVQDKCACLQVHVHFALPLAFWCNIAQCLLGY